MDINRFDTKEEASAAGGEALNRLLMDAKDMPVLLLLSGGSSFSILDYVNTKALGENLTITMLDERFSQDKEANNFLQMQKLDFYARAQGADVNFIGTLPRPNENLDDMRARLEIGIKDWQKNNPAGKIFAVFGMGADGHTAGIFPYPENSDFFSKNFENSHFISGYKAEGKHEHPERITGTFSLFKQVDEAILFVCGQDKKTALEKLLKGADQPHTLPAVGIYETKHFQIFTDIK